MFGPRRLLLALVCVFCCAAAPALAGAAEPGAIEGTVTEAGTGVPIAELKVEASRLNGEGSGEAITDSSGEYAITGLSEGEYEVNFTGQTCDPGGCSPRYAQRFYDEVRPFNPPTPVLVEAELATPDIDAELELNGAIEGTLTDSSGSPVADSFVCVNSQTEFYNDCTFSSESGEYEVPNLPPGEFNVEFAGRVCTDAGGCERESCEAGISCPRTYVSQFYDGQLNDSEADFVTVVADTPTEEVDATLVQGGQIKGKVTVAALGDPPLAGFTVCATPQAAPANGECTTTNADGEYTIAGLATNEWTVEFKEVCPEGEPCPGTYESQFYDDKAEEGEADRIDLTAPDVVNGIDASITELVPQVPSFTSKPQVTGTPVVGKTLTCSEGTWVDNPTALRFAWLRNGVPIPGAEAATYTPTSADAGNDVTCEVTIENSAGAIQALSSNLPIDPEEAKQDQPTDTGGSSSSGGSSTGTTTTTAPPPAPGTATAASKATAGRSIAVKLTCSAKGDCKITLKLSAEQKTKNAKGKTVVKWVAIGSGSVTVAAGKTATVAVPLNAKGEGLVAKAGKAGLKVKLTGSGVKPRTLTVH